MGVTWVRCGCHLRWRGLLASRRPDLRIRGGRWGGRWPLVGPVLPSVVLDLLSGVAGRGQGRGGRWHPRSVVGPRSARTVGGRCPQLPVGRRQVEGGSVVASLASLFSICQANPRNRRAVTTIPCHSIRFSPPSVVRHGSVKAVFLGADLSRRPVRWSRAHSFGAACCGRLVADSGSRGPDRQTLAQDGCREARTAPFAGADAQVQ